MDIHNIASEYVFTYICSYLSVALISISEIDYNVSYIYSKIIAKNNSSIVSQINRTECTYSTP